MAETTAETLSFQAETRQLILGELLQQDAINPEQEPPKPCLSAPPKKARLQKFAKVMERSSYVSDMWCFES